MAVEQRVCLHSWVNDKELTKEIQGNYSAQTHDMLTFKKQKTHMTCLHKRLAWYITRMPYPNCNDIRNLTETTYSEAINQRNASKPEDRNSAETSKTCHLKSSR